MQSVWPVVAKARTLQRMPLRLKAERVPVTNYRYTPLAFLDPLTAPPGFEPEYHAPLYQKGKHVTLTRTRAVRGLKESADCHSRDLNPYTGPSLAGGIARYLVTRTATVSGLNLPAACYRRDSNSDTTLPLFQGGECTLSILTRTSNSGGVLRTEYPCSQLV